MEGMHNQTRLETAKGPKSSDLNERLLVCGHFKYINLLQIIPCLGMCIIYLSYLPVSKCIF